MLIIQANEGQSLFDIAVQTAGRAEDAFSLAVTNDLAITADLVSGQQITPVGESDEEVVDYFQRRGWQPATKDDPDNVPPGGIGYMGIGIDFVVS